MGGHHPTTRHSRVCTSNSPIVPLRVIVFKATGYFQGNGEMLVQRLSPSPGGRASPWGVDATICHRRGWAALGPYKHIDRPLLPPGTVPFSSHTASAPMTSGNPSLTSLPPFQDQQNKETQTTEGGVGRGKARQINSPLSFQKVQPSSQFLLLPAASLPET